MAYDGTTAAILTNYSEVLKTFYLPAIQEQLPQMNPLSDLIQTGEKDVSGKEATINCHYGRNTGVFARADGGAFGDAGYQHHKTARIPMKHNYGLVTFSGPTIAATRSEKGAYASVIDNEISGLVKDTAKEINRQLWGAGYGTLARWRDGTTTSMTLQKKYYGNSAGGDGFGSTFGAKYFKEFNHGVPVVLTEAGSTVTVATVDATNIVVSAITEGSEYDTITCTDASVTEATGTFYVRPGNMDTVTAASSTAGAGRLEMMGLRGIVTDTDIDDIAFKGTATGMNALADPLQGLAVATYGWWKAKVNAASSGRYTAQRALNFRLFDKMFDDVASEAGEGYGPDAIFTTRALRREYKELAAADRRLVNSMTLDGGWKAIEHNGIPLLVDNDAIDGEIYFLTLKDLYIYRMSDFQWMEQDGSIFSRVSGYDAYEAVLFRYAELGTTRRNVHGVLCDLAYEV
jgi:hypothetical protein